jgi:hypothetical protein
MILETEGAELIVLDHGSVHIPLKEFPVRVEVYLKEKCAPPPCDPHHHNCEDRVSWHLSRGKRKWTLNIHWDVQGYNEIVWKVHYSRESFWVRWLNALIAIFYGD